MPIAYTYQEVTLAAAVPLRSKVFRPTCPRVRAPKSALARQKAATLGSAFGWSLAISSHILRTHGGFGGSTFDAKVVHAVRSVPIYAPRAGRFAILQRHTNRIGMEACAHLGDASCLANLIAGRFGTSAVFAKILIGGPRGQCRRGKISADESGLGRSASAERWQNYEKRTPAQNSLITSPFRMPSALPLVYHNTIEFGIGKRAYPGLPGCAVSTQLPTVEPPDMHPFAVPGSADVRYCWPEGAEHDMTLGTQKVI
jgi:hypothetical protein